MAYNQSQVPLEDQLRQMIIGNSSGPHNASQSGLQQPQAAPGMPVSHHAPVRNQRQPSGPVSSTNVNSANPQQGQQYQRQYGFAQSSRAQGAQPTHQQRNVYPHSSNQQQTSAYNPSPRLPRQLYDPRANLVARPPWRQVQAQYLDGIAAQQLPSIGMTQEEEQSMQKFRNKLERICREVCASDSEPHPVLELRCFGSVESGFATTGSDMDLVLVITDTVESAGQSSLLVDDLPRRLEKELLQLGIGARLLTKTRVPIIKICEQPTAPLLDQLIAERGKWDSRPLPEEITTGDGERSAEALRATSSVDAQLEDQNNAELATESMAIQTSEPNEIFPDDPVNAPTPEPRSRRVWTRERAAGPLDFPKTGVGVQCDINFFNPLGLHNTQLLRCYSLCDPRVRQIVLFVKAWAKQRKINSSYSGTLSSYGYVLMVLHYLANIARPPVVPNLQMPWRPHTSCTPHGTDSIELDEWTIGFWRREQEIQHAAANGLLTRNSESIGSLLAGFFRYYSSQSGQPSFFWMQTVLSLRTAGGVLTKEEKGWVKAHTQEVEGNKVHYRYLFCIEDPFELDHNVARTVTHDGIVAIRDEFRRAGRIIQAIGNGYDPQEGHLFDALTAAEDSASAKVNKSRANRPRVQDPASASNAGRVAAPAQGRVEVHNEVAFPTLSTIQPKASQPLQAKTAQQATPADAVKPEPSETKPRARGRKRGQRRIPLDMNAT